MKRIAIYKQPTSYTVRMVNPQGQPFNVDEMSVVQAIVERDYSIVPVNPPTYYYLKDTK